MTHRRDLRAIELVRALFDYGAGGLRLKLDDACTPDQIQLSPNRLSSVCAVDLSRDNGDLVILMSLRSIKNVQLR